MRQRGQRHSTALTTNVRVLDSVENPSTLMGRSTLALVIRRADGHDLRVVHHTLNQKDV